MKLKLRSLRLFVRFLACILVKRSRDGGIGRRTALRGQRSYLRRGSSPLLGTILRSALVQKVKASYG